MTIRVYFYINEINDLRTDAIFFGKEFSDDITGYSHNIIIKNIGKNTNGYYADYILQGNIRRNENDVAKILEKDFSRIIRKVSINSKGYYKAYFKKE